MKNVLALILILGLAGCGGGGNSSAPPNNTSEIPDTKPEIDSKLYNFSNFFEVTGNSYTYGVLRLKYDKTSMNNINFDFEEKPEDSKPWYSADSWKLDNNQYRISFDKSGKYIIIMNYWDLNKKENQTKKILINIKDSNIININMLKEDLILEDTSRPYALLQGISIPYNTKLIAKPGVVINGNNKLLSVEGTLDFQGTKEQKVYLYDAGIAPIGSGHSATIKIKNSVLIGGNPYASINSRIAGTLDLIDSEIYDALFDSTIYLWFPAGPVNITGNYFHKTVGIEWETSSYPINISNNKFEDWVTPNAIIAGSDATLVGNTFIKPNKDNKYAIYLRGNYNQTNLVAINNYWGTADENIIKSMILDRNSTTQSSGYITYSPYLLVADPKTPK